MNTGISTRTSIHRRAGRSVRVRMNASAAPRGNAINTMPAAIITELPSALQKSLSWKMKAYDSRLTCFAASKKGAFSKLCHKISRTGANTASEVTATTDTRGSPEGCGRAAATADTDMTAPFVDPAPLLAAECDLPLLHDLEALGLFEALQQIGAYHYGLHRTAELLGKPGARILARDVGTNGEELGLLSEDCLPAPG